MWTIFKVFIEFATTLLLFYVLVFWMYGIVGSLPGESQERWSLMGCRLWGRTESDTTEET